ncbi:winged helix-turn-helix domain-containing protein [Candidatus Uhrbacteria bacterium]|nr:winged helix-turn-helix domain-containing protein [Candidatus Uhrbacteria bacterium]
MLEHLFGSKTRVKLLSLFLRHQDEPLFVREITRRVGTQINAVRRELSNLVKLGLIMEVIEGAEGTGKKQPGLKKKYYKINPQFKLLPEISALVMRAQILLEGRLDQDILRLGDIRYLAFLGVFLGQPKAPVDLFVVGIIDANKLKTLVLASEKTLGYEINFTVMSPDEYRYRKDMTDKFLYAILESPKNVAVDRLNERDHTL